ncbi:uncharacterized protein EAE97_001076 [Botrytis byssoidea]|uniref:Uncharacterized protein n=1 Tax=Botrytis byssoidea TaxID=139641 RepID=A0A9P5M636_9HELO|nr:uncharacterized protein EAE97_001076 [Botrytis byssoidea]KAF7953677.1 hypothetical protein EAE97_001076 [Botrytis byssoidea]
MLPTQATYSAPNSTQKKSADIKCVQTTKGWVCALCFPLGHPSRALERVMNLAELRTHAAGNHYASLGQDEWDNYGKSNHLLISQLLITSTTVKNSVYFEAQFRNQSSLGFNNGVMHGPPTIASQKTPTNKAGVLKRTYVQKAESIAPESAFDLMETMINFNPIANDDAANLSSPTTPVSKTGPSGDSYAHLQFNMAPQDESEIITSPDTPSRKKSVTPKNPLRQRLSENPSFESAVSVHGLAKVQAAGNIGLQRCLDRQARGLPRTSNVPLQFAATPRNGTMDLPLTAANYAAAGMPNIQIEKPTRRTKKIDRRRQRSSSLNIADAAGIDTFQLTNTATTNTSLNIFGVPATIYGQAPGAAYKSHAYKSIYADAPSQNQLPHPELSLPGLSFADQSISNIGLDNICESFDFNSYMADTNCTVGNDSAVEATAPQQNTDTVDDFFTWAGITNHNIAPSNDIERFDADFFNIANIANTDSSEIDAMLGYGNSSSPQSSNHNFTIFKATSFEYGPAGVQVLKDAEAIISARSSLSGTSSTAFASSLNALSPSLAGSNDSSVTKASVPVVKTLSGAVAQEMAAVPLSIQELESAYKALTQELALQKGLHQADIRRRKLEEEKTTQRRENEARIKKKTDARYQRLKDQRKANEILTKQLADQKKTNDDLRKLLAQEKTSREEDKERHSAEFKEQTELVTRANATISRQVSEIDMQKKQLRQKTRVVAATTTREAEAMRAPVMQKPTIDRRKLVTAKKPVASIQAPERLVSAYDKGRKITQPSNVATAIDSTRASSSIKRAAPGASTSSSTREQVIKKARITVAGDAPRKLVPDSKGGYHWSNKFDTSDKLVGEEKKKADAEHDKEWLKIMNEHTDNKFPGNSLGIRGHLPDPKRFNDHGRF